VQRLADEHGIDLSQVQGTGISGRITRKDVLAYTEARAQSTVLEAPAASAPAVSAISVSADEERLPLSPVRRLIAANMKRGASEIPAAWSITEVDVSGLVRRREALKDDFQRREGVNLTYLHFVIKAVAESLRENPLLNSSWADDAIILKKRINIGIAVAAPDGLVVPVLRDADTLSVAGIAVRASDLTARARQGKLAIEDVQGGTFTLNNTGALGSIASQPIINHPQAAILTTEAIVKRPVVIGDAIGIRSLMNICLTFDHRIMDGAEASAFSNAVKRRLEAICDDTGIY
jgi:2-oxoisovalerate dehydrogenase E2 component (dihydrolipoyl transacylase)